MASQLVRFLYRDTLKTTKLWQKELQRGKGSIRLNVELEPLKVYLHEQQITHNNLTELVEVVRRAFRGKMPAHASDTETSQLKVDDAFYVLRVARKSLAVLQKMPTFSQKSLATTHGVQVEVTSVALNKPAYKYHVLITNNTKDTIQLTHRHWIIAQVPGGTNVAEGLGVMSGQQPIIKPGGQYSYINHVTINSPYGYMKGKYTFKTLPTENHTPSQPLSPTTTETDITNTSSQSNTISTEKEKGGEEVEAVKVEAKKKDEAGTEKEKNDNTVIQETKPELEKDSKAGEKENKEGEHTAMTSEANVESGVDNTDTDTDIDTPVFEERTFDVDIAPFALIASYTKRQPSS